VIGHGSIEAQSNHAIILELHYNCSSKDDVPKREKSTTYVRGSLVCYSAYFLLETRMIDGMD
jgi:hypothetical protein